MKISIIIPSRLASTRLPQKPLADILGQSLIERVYKQASQVQQAEVIVATDSKAVYNHVLKFGGKVMMTSKSHQSGTDRVAEVAAKLDSDVIINLQGDEPLIDPQQIEELIELMKNANVQIGTQCAQIHDPDMLFDYNVVKVVRDHQNKALYFSRQAIPAIRDQKYEFWMQKTSYYKHIGMYGFKRKALLDIQQLRQSDYEIAESLEQLRWLQHGYTIHCVETKYSSIGVDTPEDLERVRDIVLREMFH